MLKTIRQDEHGLLINFDGNTYRPQESRWADDPFLHRMPLIAFKKGDKVSIKNIAHSPYILVEGFRWFDHGTYVSKIGYSSGVFPWNPKPVTTEEDIERAKQIHSDFEKFISHRIVKR